MTYYRYVCDRNGGVKGAYLRRKPWTCPRCGEKKYMNGHICVDCRKRVCCQCFHHDLGCCLSAEGSDVDAGLQVEKCKPKVLQGVQRNKRGVQ